MDKLKQFIKKRSKILLASCILSLILFILICPQLVNYSNYINNGMKFDLKSMNSLEFDDTMVKSTFVGMNIYEFNIITSSLLIFITLYNIVGYLYKKNEFILISVGLSVALACMSLYIEDFMGITILFAILNIMGYIEQMKIQRV